MVYTQGLQETEEKRLPEEARIRQGALVGKVGLKREGSQPNGLFCSSSDRLWLRDLAQVNESLCASISLLVKWK